MQKIKHIIWDWNGTLLNDGWVFVNVMNTLLKSRDLPLINIKEYRKYFGFPVIEYYKHLGFDFKKESFEDYGKDFIKIYKKHQFDAELHNDSIKILKKFYNQKIKNHILSASHIKFLYDSVEYYDIKKYFSEIFGLKNYHAKGKIDIATELFSLINCKNEEVLLIGDTIHDNEVANHLNIKSFLVTNGHQNKQRLKKTNSKIVSCLSDIITEYEK